MPQEDPGQLWFFPPSGMPLLFLGAEVEAEAQQPPCQLWFLTNDTCSEHMSTLPPPQTFGKAQATLAPSAGT